MFSLVILYSTLLACSAFIGVVAWRYDLYDREPPAPIAAAILLGAVLMFLAGRAQGVLIDLTVDHALSMVSDTTWAAFAGITEEIAKLTTVVLILVLFRRHFNDPMDGLVYGAFAGLGAAIEESVFHMGFKSTTMILPGQEPVRLAGHLVMGGIGGFGLGMLAIRHPRWWAWTLGSLAGAIVLHFLWDVVAFAAAERARDTGKTSWTFIASGVGLMFVGMVGFRGLVARGSRLSKRHFSSAT
ncbi:hypothetical protein PHYC_03980 [Phycisphaerales bacterium]|nr:hypothetical protein PHYC_03980 [Phycisphaerales bacterium]